MLIWPRILFCLAILLLIILYFIREQRNQKWRRKLVTETANKLLELVDDEKPILLKVDQEKLIEKTVDEIKRRKDEGRW